MQVSILAKVGLTMSEDTSVRIEEILILKLSPKSTSLELVEILVRKRLKSSSANLDRSKTSL